MDIIPSDWPKWGLVRLGGISSAFSKKIFVLGWITSFVLRYTICFHWFSQWLGPNRHEMPSCCLDQGWQRLLIHLSVTGKHIETNKLTAISLTTFWNTFLQKKSFIFLFKSIEGCSWLFSSPEVGNGWGNGLAPNSGDKHYLNHCWPASAWYHMESQWVNLTPDLFFNECAHLLLEITTTTFVILQF